MGEGARCFRSVVCKAALKRCLLSRNMKAGMKRKVWRKEKILTRSFAHFWTTTPSCSRDSYSTVSFCLSLAFLPTRPMFLNALLGFPKNLVSARSLRSLEPGTI